MSAPMVRALLAGHKTMTRRLPTSMWTNIAWAHNALHHECWLWVREKWAESVDSGPLWIYAADYDDGWNRIDDGLPPWRPSIHMSRWASRLSLKVEAIGLERLQDISEEDARDEGCQMSWIAAQIRSGTWRGGFEDLWNSLHAKLGTRWKDNPEIYAIRFVPHQRNIDGVRRDAA